MILCAITVPIPGRSSRSRSGAVLMSTFSALALWLAVVDLCLPGAASAVGVSATHNAAAIDSTAAKWRTARSAEPRGT